MSSNYVVNVEAREETGTSASRRLRRAGKIPAIMYSKGKETKNFTVSVVDWKKVGKSEASVLELKTADGSTYSVLVKEEQYDYLADRNMHIDFTEIDLNATIHAAVAIKHIGEPAGSSQGGLLEQLVYEIEIECLVKDLPSSINVDVSSLEVEHNLKAKDITLAEGLTLKSTPEQVIFLVSKVAAATSAETAEADEEAKPAE